MFRMNEWMNSTFLLRKLAWKVCQSDRQSDKSKSVNIWPTHRQSLMKNTTISLEVVRLIILPRRFTLLKFIAVSSELPQTSTRGQSTRLNTCANVASIMRNSGSAGRSNMAHVRATIVIFSQLGVALRSILRNINFN